MSNNIFVVKGVSGSGKSSRVFQLLKYLQSRPYLTTEDFRFVNIEEKEVCAGVLIKELDLIFIGKVYESGGVERWQGYDAVTSRFKSSSNFSDFLRDYMPKYNFVVEGAGVSVTHRLRPKFLHEYCNFNNIFIQYYNFEQDQKYEYVKRIILRSGKYSPKDKMWDKAKSFTKEYDKTLQEIQEVSGVNVQIFYNSYTTPIDDFGIKFFDFIDCPEEKDMFKLFVEQYDYINKNRHENFGS